MFAAEVEYHADFTNSYPFHGDGNYERAIRADMAIGEEEEYGYYYDYYDLNGSLVQAQINAHGEF